MEAAVGAASWLVGKLLEKLSDDLVAAYVASKELGLNTEQIKQDLMYTQALLYAAQGRDVNNPGLKGLLQQLARKADEAEDALDELHYFMIQDQLDGTHHATPFLGGDIQETIQHCHNVVRHTAGNWFSCFPCLRQQIDDDSAAATATPNDVTDSGSGHVDGLTFDRVAMSTKIKSVMEAIQSKCTPVSNSLNIIRQNSIAGKSGTPIRTPIGSLIDTEKTVDPKALYGRGKLLDRTISNITGGIYHSETLYVLPIVGPGGIGKTTFTKHLYNHPQIQDHFTVMVWICVSTDFHVLGLTQQIHDCIPATEKEQNNIVTQTSNLDLLQISIACRLKSKRFLIVLDDIWKCGTHADWSNLLVPFTQGEAKGSMVLVTTRFPKIKEKVIKETIPINLQGLEPKEFKEFFNTCLYGQRNPDGQYNEVIHIGEEISEKLKGSPLAAITVARLLKANISWEHWRKVLENNGWVNETNSDDIMPALKISYDYLPFHLKECFLYFSLFPEDHRFTNKEIARFWTAIGIIDSSYGDKNYLEELVGNGFLVKENEFYVMHDLLHELSQIVSSQQCLNIASLSFSSDAIPSSIKHVSITIENRYDENFRAEMAVLKSKIKIENLWSLMIFREYEERTARILTDTFNKVEGLRVLFIGINSQESLPMNFSKLLHLRHLKIRSPAGLTMSLPTSLSRFYHLMFLDLQDWHGSCNLPKDISRLVNLHHFIADNELHSNVPEVGKIKHLEELKQFHVKKERVGFELEELGKLRDLGGELSIYNLEKVATKEEANKAKLVLKKNLKRLVLIWGIEQLCTDADVVDGLQPHGNIRELAIEDHGGATAIGPPRWLCHDIPIKHLESLTLDGVSWGTLPSFGQLPYLKFLRLKNIAKLSLIGPGHSFKELKEVELDNIPYLEKWVAGPDSQQFSKLESIKCSNCPNVIALPFLSDCQQETHYPTLFEFIIRGCPKLSLPPMPHAPTLTHVEISDNLSSVHLLNDSLVLSSYIYDLALENMVKVERIISKVGSKIPLPGLEQLTSLRKLSIEGDSSIKSMSLLSNLTLLTTLELMDCKNLTVEGFNPIITCKLRELKVYNSRDLHRSIAADLFSELVVASRSKLPAGVCFQYLHTLTVDSISAVLAAPICILLATTLHELAFSCDERVESLMKEEEEALHLITSLQSLQFSECPALPSLPQVFHTLPIMELRLYKCPNIRALPKGGIPTSLQQLIVEDCNAKLHEEIEKSNLKDQIKLVVNE